MLGRTFATLFLVVALFLASCRDGDGTVRPPPIPPASPTPAGSLPPVDGTVAPQNPGDTLPVIIKPNPDPVTGIATLTDVRVGAHPEQGGWDRIVFEFRDSLPGGKIEYVDVAHACGSGEVVRLSGRRLLLVSFEPANAHDDAGRSTIRANRVTGPGNAILESRQICDFEAHVDWAVGVSGEQRFKVTTLRNPTRLVIDVKW